MFKSENGTWIWVAAVCGLKVRDAVIFFGLGFW